MNDQVQRQQALDVSQSFIVQAPAGSGKTELLTRRYLKLLSVSASPESVIAMTFTKKAVSELTTRVIESLKLAKGNRPKELHKQITYDLALKVLEKSKTLDWQLLHTPERLKISTIDGLSSLITSRYPGKNQLVPKQIIAQNWARNDIYLQAAKQTLLAIDEPEYKNSIESVLLYLDNNVNKFYRLITDMLAKRDQWLLKLYQHGVLNIKTLRLSSESVIIQHLQLLKNEAKHLNGAFFDLLKYNTQSKFSQIKTLPNTSIECLDVWVNIADLLLDGKNKKNNKWRKSVNTNNGFPTEVKAQKDEFIKFLNHLQGKDNFKDLLFETLNLPDVDFSTNQINALQDIAQVLKLAVAQLNILFDVNQKHDFIQVALDADHALDEHQVSDVALFLDNKVQHILIDEFQDTSATQFVLLEKLIVNWQVGDGKTLFLVGDPMQSIYLFRQSRVGLFLQVRTQGIANITPEFLQLSTNFRSSKPVVEGNNKIFSKIFPQQEDAFKGAIKYEYSHANSVDENENAISFYPFAHKRYDFEAQKVLEIIQNNPTKEIAILVRNRSHLGHIVPVLKCANIQFEALKTFPLKEDLFTRDLLSLTRALKHLGDKLAWLAILRAPWCGLLLEDLLVLSQQDDRVIFDLIQDEQVLQGLSENGQLRVRNFSHVLRDIVNQQSRFSFTKVLEFAISQLAPQDSLSVKQSMIKAQFLQIIHDCESAQQLDIEIINQMLDELYAPSVNARIKIMTIHEAKGLEFELVIIPGLGRAPQNNKPPIIHLQEFSNQSLLLAPIRSYTQLDDSHTYTYLKHIASQQNKFETMRLLYVAMTRAKLEIHLLGTLNQSNQASSNTFLKLLAPIFQHQFDTFKLSTIEDNQQSVQAPELVRYIKPLEYDNLLDESKENMDLQLSVDLQYKSLLGTLLHQYYEDGFFSPDKQSIRARLIECGVGNMDIDSRVDFTVNMLNLTKQDKYFFWLFKQRTSTQVEAEFISHKHRVIIDRLFIDKDTLWIIDFKTATKSNDESIAQFIQRQKTKYTQQLLSYKVALSACYSMEIKCALYCPAVQELIEMDSMKFLHK